MRKRLNSFFFFLGPRSTEASLAPSHLIETERVMKNTREAPLSLPAGQQKKTAGERKK
jgi:hypothetical protein